MADSDFDLRSLPEIARDRSAAGRARLFAFLAALLVSRWQSLSAGERHELAALIAILWPRGTEADRAKLAADLAGKADLPETLHCLLPAAATTAPPAQDAAMRPPVDLSPADSSSASSFPPASFSDLQVPSDDLPVAPAPRKKGISIQITQQPVLRVARSPSSPSISTSPIPTPTSSGPSLSIDRPVIRVPSRSPGMPVEAPAGINGKLSSKGAPASAAARAAPVVAASGQADLPQPAAAMSIAPDVQPAGGAGEPLPIEPRANPHRLTTELLGEVLASGDFARFEVMLASMTGLRAALLRRVLRDSGGEALAILARAAGAEQEVFASQWRHWQQHQADLGRPSIDGEQSQAKRVNAFFAALTDQQIDRLIRRWRSDENRFFAAPAFS